MKQRQLEMILEQLKAFSAPSAALEQYSTPAPIAAQLLHFAYLRGDIWHKQVVDLGCGTGILAIGAALLEATATGVDADERALQMAQMNADAAGINVTWVKSPIQDFQGAYDTVVMNPPFGAQKRHSDRPFLLKATEVGKVIYLLHNAIVNDFVRRFLEPNRVTDAMRIKLPLAHSFKFHKQEVRYIDAILYRIETFT
ncbi:MAG: METTL5 family protein [Euryarchaeota archaeon]|nr:METTL5 family protein [Euryarchaeota archaeon]